MAKKRAAQARLAAQEAGIYVEDDGNENIFELQHHHLLRCLEKTTVRSKKQFRTFKSIIVLNILIILIAFI